MPLNMLVPAAAVVAIVAIIAVTKPLESLVKMWLDRPRRAAIPQADLKAIREGLGRMEQAIDAIAVEVERLSEGQRFTTRLLAESARNVAPAPAKRVVE